MSALDPSGPSQPSLDEAYTTPGNPATKNPAEKSESAHRSLDDSVPVDKRIPTKQASEDEATPSAMARGIRGAGPGEESKGLSHEDVGRHKELDGQQMAAPGEGDVADAVAGRGDALSGGGGEQPDFASDLDRKKEEQREAREAIQGKRQQGVEQGGALGQQGGPANPVGKDNYPNSDKY